MAPQGHCTAVFTSSCQKSSRKRSGIGSAHSSGQRLGNSRPKENSSGEWQYYKWGPSKGNWLISPSVFAGPPQAEIIKLSTIVAGPLPSSAHVGIPVLGIPGPIVNQDWGWNSKLERQIYNRTIELHFTIQQCNPTIKSARSNHTMQSAWRNPLDAIHTM